MLGEIVRQIAPFADASWWNSSLNYSPQQRLAKRMKGKLTVRKYINIFNLGCSGLASGITKFAVSTVDNLIGKILDTRVTYYLYEICMDNY